MSKALTYHEQGDCLLPDIQIGSTRETESLGRFGVMRRTYLREHREILYNSLLLNGTLHEHLLSVQAEAESRVPALMKLLVAQNPPPDKASDQMGWVAHMNSLRQTAEETVRNEVIYV
jgi:hypothetical protein